MKRKLNESAKNCLQFYFKHFTITSSSEMNAHYHCGTCRIKTLDGRQMRQYEWMFNEKVFHSSAQNQYVVPFLTQQFAYYRNVNRKWLIIRNWRSSHVRKNNFGGLSEIAASILGSVFWVATLQLFRFLFQLEELGSLMIWIKF